MAIIKLPICHDDATWLQKLPDALEVRISTRHGDLLEAGQPGPHRLVPLADLRAVADAERAQVGQVRKHRVADTGALPHVEVLEAGQVGEMRVPDLLATADIKEGQAG